MITFIKESIGLLDLIAWLLVIIFFLGSSLLFNGNILFATLGAAGIIVEMVFIGIAIEIIIESLKNTKGIGTLTGFITNGPEAVCLLVGLLVGDVIFAASTPLGSNFMNPMLLLVAAIICRSITEVIRTRTLYFLTTVVLTAFFAGSFFFLSVKTYPWWLGSSIVGTLVLFFLRPREEQTEQQEEHDISPALWLFPSIIVLTLAGYFLDPIVSFTAHHSMAPKGVIGFIVLATLTSWPEFKSCLVLLRKQKYLAAILNIAVSNITNLWLAAIGVSTYLLLHWHP